MTTKDRFIALLTAAEHWHEIGDESEAEAATRSLLVSGGLLKAKISVKVQAECGPGALNIHAEVSGEHKHIDFQSRLLGGSIPPLWLDETGKTKYVLAFKHGDELSVKRTYEGDEALEELQDTNASLVVDWILRRGRFVNRLPAPPKLTIFDRVFSDDEQPSSAKVKLRKPSREELNLECRSFLTANPEATVREIAAGIGCSTGMVSGLPAYKAVAEQRALGRKPKPKATTLTETMADLTPAEDGDGELARLIKEQRRDNRTSRVQSRERI